MRSVVYTLCVAIFILTSCSKEIAVGKLTGGTFTWEEIAPQKGAAFIFFSPECPLSENYSLTMNNYAEKYKDEGISTYLVFSGRLYSVDEIVQFTATYIKRGNVLMDSDYQLRDYFQASITPEVFLTDHQAQVLYSGKIDNWTFSLGKQRQKITEHYLVDATESLLSGEEINISKTEAVGCLIE